MAFYSRVLLIAFLSTRALAIDVIGIYSNVCDRSVGILLDVDAISIYFLNLDGNIMKMPRYDIVSMAIYPTDALPIKRIRNGLKRNIGLVTVKTKHENNIVHLMEGWPIQFSQDKISFLNKKDGQEVIVDRQSIWEIDITNTPKNQIIQSNNVARYQFVHPYNQYNCKKEFYGNRKGRTVSVFPEEYISNPVRIKRRLDTIMDHHEMLKAYNRQQKFYAVPQIYTNQTSLGNWFTVGSRHGANKYRSNNITPILSNEYSAGPFSYQHLFLSGSAPLNTLIHEEPQTQFYYRLKADYINFSMFFDPSMILLGEKYQWHLDDFKDEGDRHVENFAMSVGLDFGHFSGFLQHSEAWHGFKRENAFGNTSGSVVKLGLRYQNHWMSMELISGNGETMGGSSLSLGRYNLKLNLWNNMSYDYSFISRTFKGLSRDLVDFKRDEDPEKVIYESKSYTNAIYGNYRLRYKYIFQVMLAHEFLQIKDGDSSSFFKLGASANLIF